nr:enoyl-[acyl-carrier-protein] reductase [NADH], chloroplastic-like [Tanacetum cinerariifolium]
MTTKAVSESSDTKVLPGLPVDLRGKRAFIAGIADDNGYGWAIAKSLAAAGAEILVGTWVPGYDGKDFTTYNSFPVEKKDDPNIVSGHSKYLRLVLQRGKFDESRVVPLDAVYDTPEDVPEDVKSNRRYVGCSLWTVKEVAESVKEDFGSIDILVHSLANGPEDGALGGRTRNAVRCLEGEDDVMVD